MKNKYKQWFKTFCIVPFLLSPSLAFAYAEKNYFSIFLDVFITFLMLLGGSFIILAGIDAGTKLIQGQSIKTQIIKIILGAGLIFSAPYLVHNKLHL
jgi:hypothetical protein